VNLGRMRSRVQMKIRDKRSSKVSDSFIDDLINEGLRIMASKTLQLEGLDTSLTYSSANDGFAVPSDFLKVKYIEWITSNVVNRRINPMGLPLLRKKRNEFSNLDLTTVDAVSPNGYAIQNGYIVLDSTTQTSPRLYYYKYDTSLSVESSTPSFDSEYHQLLVSYAVWQLTNDTVERDNWLIGITDMLSARPEAEYTRTRYVGL